MIELTYTHIIINVLRRLIKLFYSKHNNVYKQCTKVTNINSSTYKKYKKDLNLKLNTIQFIFIYIAIFGIPFFIEFGQTSIPISDQIFDISLIFVIPGLILWHKHRNKSFFVKDPSFKEMALSSNFDKYSLVYQNASNQLNKNKEAVRRTFKLSKYIFMVLVINSLEDNIKNLFISRLYNFNLWVAFIWMIVTLLFYFLHWSYLIGNIIIILMDIATKANNIIDTCIDHGLFVKNYALLYSTIKIVEEKDANKTN